VCACVFLSEGGRDASLPSPVAIAVATNAPVDAALKGHWEGAVNLDSWTPSDGTVLRAGDVLLEWLEGSLDKRGAKRVPVKYPQSEVRAAPFEGGIFADRCPVVPAVFFSST
jgi:hypothetical protein